MNTSPRILSIQSHVAHGYAGNKCAVFPLQLLGFEVDFINSVQFSNHTGYPVVKGTKMTAQELHDLYEGLKLNQISQYSHILTGYVGGVEFLKELSLIVRDIKSHNNDAIYVCDPVLGDNGKFYVAPELARVYRELLLPLCDILTPNQFELGILTGMDVSTHSNIVKAIDKLHEMGVPSVALSSASFSNEKLISCIGSCRKNNTRFRVDIPRLPADLVGTGDLFAATTLAWSSKTKSLETAVRNAVNTIHVVIKDTLSCCETLEESQQDLPAAARVELRIVQNADIILNPPQTMAAIRI